MQGALPAQAATAAGGSGAAGCCQLSSAASSRATGSPGASGTRPALLHVAASPLAKACSAPLAAAPRIEATLSAATRHIMAACNANTKHLLLQSRPDRDLQRMVDRLSKSCQRSWHISCATEAPLPTP